MIDYAFLQSLDFSVAWTYLPVLLGGLLINVLLTAIGFLCGGIVVGTTLALANLSSHRIIRWPALAFIEFWRSTPLLVQAIWVHFAVPGLTGIATSPFQSASIALIFNVAAYCSEIIQGARFLTKKDREHIRQVTDRHVAVIEGWIAAGKMLPVDPRHLFIMLWASTQFYSDFEPVAIDALKTSRLKAGDYDKAAATIAETILRGILPCS